MALLPLILSELDSLRGGGDATTVLDLYLDDLPSYPRLRHRHLAHPYSRSHLLRRRPRLCGAASSRREEGFKVSLDVQQFRPEELAVKVADGHVVVEGKHEERRDQHGYVKRHFTRRYKLPAEVDADTVVSSLSSDGVLTVSAANKCLEPPAKGERSIPIDFTEVPAAVTTDDSNPAAASPGTEKDDKRGEKMEQ